MKVLIVADVLGEENNGTTIACFNLARYLISQGDEVRFLCSDQEKKDDPNYFVVPERHFGFLIDYLIHKNNVHLSKPDKKIIRKAIEGVDIVKYGEGMVDQLITVFDTVQKISIISVIALILVTAFLISNTIKITIASREREIGIMRLIGASNLNIRIPFIIEGLLLGALGSIIPIIITIYGYNILYQKFDGQLFSPFIKLIAPNPFVYTTSLILLGIGVLVGMFGSWRAVRKHLKI